MNINQHYLENMLPAGGRRTSMLEALTLTLDFLKDRDRPVFVEMGTSRDTTERGRYADGWGTYSLGWFASKVGGHLHSIDTDPKAIKKSQEVAGEFRNHITWHTAPAQEIVRTLPHIDFFYFDGPHGGWRVYDVAATIHLNTYKALNNKPKVVIVDDVHSDHLDLDAYKGEATDFTYGVKGRLLIPQMLSDGYTLYKISNNQAILHL